MGMIAGVGAPLEALAHEGEDWAIWCAVVEEALRIKDERDLAMVKAQGRIIGGACAEAVASMLAL